MRALADKNNGMLVVRGVSHQFPKVDHKVLRDVDLTVRDGEFVSIIGSSGCGKTTLLRIVAGLQIPDAGSVYLDGELSMGPSRSKSMVFQHFNLLPWRSALANVAYGLELAGVDRSTREARAHHFLKLVGLEGFEGHYPGELSGGMQQRVGIARALAVEPKVLLMDEPFGAVDALTREHLQGELQRICHQTGVTVLFITHSIDEAIYLSDRVNVMGKAPGEIIRDVTVDLPRPRWDYDVKSERRFGELRSELWHLLSRQIVDSSETTSATATYDE